MIKTFIWNTEYDVFAANSDTVENARLLLLYEFIKKSREYLIDEKDKESINKNCIPSYVLARAQAVIGGDLVDFVEIYKREPDKVLEETKAMIYTHTNE